MHKKITLEIQKNRITYLFDLLTKTIYAEWLQNKIEVETETGWLKINVR